MNCTIQYKDPSNEHPSKGYIILTKHFLNEWIYAWQHHSIIITQNNLKYSYHVVKEVKVITQENKHKAQILLQEKLYTILITLDASSLDREFQWENTHVTLNC